MRAKAAWMIAIAAATTTVVTKPTTRAGADRPSACSDGRALGKGRQSWRPLHEVREQFP
jgi:hypothetical protein